MFKDYYCCFNFSKNRKKYKLVKHYKKISF